MSGFDTIQFTQEQTRTLTRVSSETMRHWRKMVPHLAAKQGKSARFSFADIICLMVAHELISTFGVHIACIGKGVDVLFQRLSETRPATLEDTIAVVTSEDTSLVSSGDLIARRLIGPVMAVPLAPLIERLRRGMMPIAPPAEQTTLPFPPRAVRVGNEAESMDQAGRMTRTRKRVV